MGTKNPGAVSEEFRCTLGELLLEEDRMRKSYLEPFDKLDANQRGALYDKLQQKMHLRFGHMLELVVRMRKQLKAIGGGGK